MSVEKNKSNFDLDCCQMKKKQEKNKKGEKKGKPQRKKRTVNNQVKKNSPTF